MDAPDLPLSNILVVDDTPDNLRLLVSLLNQHGYKVRPVTRSKLALAAAQVMPPDLILLDINMPEMDGYELCTRLKADARTRDIPVIFLSALNDLFDKVKAFSVGGVDYITKPFQVEEVVSRIQTHLTLRTLQKRLEEQNQELTQTLTQLQNTQAQMILSEKMAALGQLVANVAHEMNTPLGAIQSSADNIASTLADNLEALPRFLQTLSPERQADFFALLQPSTQGASTQADLSSREKRQQKRQVMHMLDAWAIADSDTKADTLVDLGITTNLEAWLPLLRDPQSQNILQMAYQLASLQKSTQTIKTAVNRATKVVLALKSYARYDPSGNRVEANLLDGIETALTLYQNQLKHGVEVVRHYTELPLISCFPDDLNQVWTNLICNALQAMDYQGTLTIRVTPQADHVQISISDTGRGIPPEIQPKIFEPFFTTKAMGEGSGLGLSIVKKVIDKHRGAIAVESRPSQTTFTITLPIAAV